jgi:hypothetical protein
MVRDTDRRARRFASKTIPGRHWFSWFRLYGPLEPYFDRAWKLNDIRPA